MVQAPIQLMIVTILTPLVYSTIDIINALLIGYENQTRKLKLVNLDWEI